MAAGVKIVVIYPRPQDEAAFERDYKETHLPMVEDKIKGITRLVATKVHGSPQGETRTFRMAELHFPNMEALNAALETFAPGVPNAGVLDRLNTSQRNCMLNRSFILKLRNRLPSRFL